MAVPPQPGEARLGRRAFLAAAALAGLTGCDSGTAPAKPATHPASAADDLVQHYGINTKFFYDSTVYRYTDEIVGLVRELGARIVRERLTTGASAGVANQERAIPLLAQSGIRWHATVGEIEDLHRMSTEKAAAVAGSVVRDSLQKLVSVYEPRSPGRDLARLMHSLGGANEVNPSVGSDVSDPDWAAHARLYQEQLWTQANAHPSTATLPVAGPSTRTDTTFEQGAELAGTESDPHIMRRICDRGNAHLYQRGVSPDRGVDVMLAILRPCYNGFPTLFTEAGYNNAMGSPEGTPVPEQVAATYGPRALCVFYQRRAVYMRFELMDDPDPSGTNRDAHFGLVAMTENKSQAPPPSTWRKKPEFHTMRRFTRLLADPGPAFTPTGLTYAANSSSDVQQLLVQKRDQRHYLLLWRDVDVYVPNGQGGGTPVDVAPVEVAVELRADASVTIYKPVSGGSAKDAEPRSVRKVRRGRTFSVPIDGDLQVAEITPV